MSGHICIYVSCATHLQEYECRVVQLQERQRLWCPCSLNSQRNFERDMEQEYGRAGVSATVSSAHRRFQRKKNAYRGLWPGWDMVGDGKTCPQRSTDGTPESAWPSGRFRDSVGPMGSSPTYLSEHATWASRGPLSDFVSCAIGAPTHNAVMLAAALRLSQPTRHIRQHTVKRYTGFRLSSGASKTEKPLDDTSDKTVAGDVTPEIPSLHRPLGIPEPPTTEVKTFSQKGQEFLDRDKVLQNRRHL